jgi:DNA-binding response OmpR family regulator
MNTATQTENQKPRILYLDDDENLLTIMQEVLTLNGFDVTCTTSPDDIPEAANQHYDAIIVDMIWPQMDNMDLCMGLIRDGYTGKIIIATTRNLPIEEWDVFDGLNFGLLMKPYGPRELIQRMRQALVKT